MFISSLWACASSFRDSIWFLGMSRSVAAQITNWRFWFLKMYIFSYLLVSCTKLWNRNPLIIALLQRYAWQSPFIRARILKECSGLGALDKGMAFICYCTAGPEPDAAAATVGRCRSGLRLGASWPSNREKDGRVTSAGMPVSSAVSQLSFLEAVNLLSDFTVSHWK